MKNSRPAWYIKVLLLLLLASNANLTTAGEFFSSVELFTYSDANIHENDWDSLGPYKPGNISFVHSTAEAGIVVNNLTVAMISRYDFWTEFNEDTGELLYLKGNSYQPELGREYTIDLKVNHIRAKGVKFGYSWQKPWGLENLQATMSLSYLTADRLLDGRVKGPVTEVESNEYIGDLAIDYNATKDVFFSGIDSPDQGSGRGISIDAGLTWEFQGYGRLQFAVTDLYSRIDWNDVTYSDYVANPRNPEIVDGKLQVYSTVYGKRNRQAEIEQQLPMRAIVDGRFYLFKHLHLLTELRYYEPITLTRLGISWSFTPHTNLNFYHSAMTGASEIAFVSRYFWLAVQADNRIEDDVAIDKLLTAGVKLGFSIPVF